MAENKRPIEVNDLYQIAYVQDPRISPDGRWIAYVHQTVDKVDNGYKRNIWLAPTGSGQPLQLTRGGKDTQPRWSPDGRWLAFVSGRDQKPQIYLLYLREPGGEARALTAMENGATNPTWSPDGTHIAFLSSMSAAERAKEDGGEAEAPPADKFDAKQRKERKEHDEEKRLDPLVFSRIPYREGTEYRDGRYAQIYVMATAEGLEGNEAKPRRLTDIDADHSQPEWSPDGQYLLTSRAVDPDDDEPFWRMAVYQINVSDRQTTRLTDDSYSCFQPLPSPDGRWISYVRRPRKRLSERINRLTIMPADGGESRDLNLILDRSVEEYRWAKDSQALVFNATSWGDTEIYRANLDDGQIGKIVERTIQISEFDVDADGSLAFAANTPLSLPELYWRAANADQPVKLTSVNQKLLDTINVQPTHELRFKSPSGIELQGWYILPVGYEEGKTYPLALNVHGGPHVMWGPSERSMWHEWQFHSARGYAVFYCNPRGADGYGEAFQEALHASWGDVAFGDLMAGLNALLELGFVDTNRMAVTGGSYGGYMTAWIVGHTERFAAAVSQRGVYNLLSFYGTSDVPSLISDEFGVLPWDDAAFLWQQSPIAYAHNIRTPLLIFHSENDFRVPVSDGEQLFAYVRKSGGTVQMVRFPREGHELSRSGEPEHRVARLSRMVEWFDRYCLPATSSP